MAAKLYRLPGWWIGTVQDFYDRAYPIGEGLRISVSSWQRSIEENRFAQGDPRSQHLVATAWDVVPQRGAPWSDADEYARRARAAGLYVIDERNRAGHGAHWHVQLFAKGRVPESVFDSVAVA